ncbi:uncharacterized protein LOC109727434 [Ananas comosus]|uniref:Uncharacterized protein LOC109727434 n=1 Tax=Ananas comosus TaxID=4615 RepID=A0A6P5H9I1_ANACO|nr:uncharacterized protein LOC109727434 [Ananas comosus]
MVPTPDSAPPLDVPESSVADEIQDLRDQVAALVGVVRRQAEASQQLAEASQRQEEQMALLRELVSRQAATAPVTQQPPISPVRAPAGVEGAGAAAPPPMAYTAPPGVAAGTCSAMSSTSTPIDPALEAERDRALACLTAFKKFNPPIFNGESGDPWEMESWVDTMEKLFEDLYTLEQDKVHLAVHCLEKYARVWWKATRQNRSPTLPPMMWEEFRGLLYGVHFSDSEMNQKYLRFLQCRMFGRILANGKRGMLLLFSQLLRDGWWSRNNTLHGPTKVFETLEVRDLKCEKDMLVVSVLFHPLLTLMPFLAHSVGEEKLLTIGLLASCTHVFLYSISWSYWSHLQERLGIVARESRLARHC